MITVNVTYRLEDRFGLLISDARLEKAAGKISDSSGYLFKKFLRDLQFNFRKRERAQQAAKKLRAELAKLKLKGSVSLEAS